jgi:hypothetical protein
MADWLIRVIGKRHKETDKDLLVQAVLALGRQLWEQEQAKRATKGENSAEESAS